MKILAVEDERMSLELLVDLIREYDRKLEIYPFTDSAKAWEFAKDNRIDVAFLDVQMPEVDGISLGKNLQDIYPEIDLVYTTAYPEHAVEAFDMRASGYLLKPISLDKVKKEMESLRNKAPSESRVKITCFGRFDIHIDGMVPKFSYKKTKEMLAYLVDQRGASCDTKAIMTALWEDDKHASYVRNLRKDLMDVFRQHGCEDVVINNTGALYIQTDKVDCDYYKWLKDPKSVWYQGEYMEQFSWAEETKVRLDKHL